MRGLIVTGVQTCALPICNRTPVPILQHPGEVDPGVERDRDRGVAGDGESGEQGAGEPAALGWADLEVERVGDRKSTRLNATHDQISDAVGCLKKTEQLGA